MFRRVVNTHTHTCKKKKKEKKTCTQWHTFPFLADCTLVSLFPSWTTLKIPVVVWLLLLTQKRNVHLQLMDEWMKTHTQTPSKTHTCEHPCRTLLLCNDWTTGCLHYGLPSGNDYTPALLRPPVLVWTTLTHTHTLLKTIIELCVLYIRPKMWT